MFSFDHSVSSLAAPETSSANLLSQARWLLSFLSSCSCAVTQLFHECGWDLIVSGVTRRPYQVSDIPLAKAHVCGLLSANTANLVFYVAEQRQVDFVIISGSIYRLQGLCWLPFSAGTGGRPCQYTSSVRHRHISQCFPSTDPSTAEAESNIPFRAAVSLWAAVWLTALSYFSLQKEILLQNRRGCAPLHFELVHLCIARGNSTYLRAVVSLF